MRPSSSRTVRLGSGCRPAGQHRCTRWRGNSSVDDPAHAVPRHSSIRSWSCPLVVKPLARTVIRWSSRMPTWLSGRCLRTRWLGAVDKADEGGAGAHWYAMPATCPRCQCLTGHTSIPAIHCRAAHMHTMFIGYDGHRHPLVQAVTRDNNMPPNVMVRIHRQGAWRLISASVIEGPQGAPGPAGADSMVLVRLAPLGEGPDLAWCVRVAATAYVLDDASARQRRHSSD